MYPTPAETKNVPAGIASASDPATATRGLVCGHCRKRLDSVAVDMACPDCGYGVRLSLQEKNHERFNEQWLRSISIGLVTLIAATTMMLLMDGSTIVYAMGVFHQEKTKPVIMPMHLVFFGIIIGLIIALAYAFWVLSWPDANKRYPGLSVHGRWIFLAFLASVPITFAWQVYVSQGQSKIWDKISTTSKLVIITGQLALTAVWVCLIFLAAQVARTYLAEQIKNRLLVLMSASVIIPVVYSICFQVLARNVHEEGIESLRHNMGHLEAWLNLVIYAGLIYSYVGLMKKTKEIERAQQVAAHKN